MKILDGSGKGNFAKVDDKLRLTTFAATQSLDQNINLLEGKVWSYYQSTTATAIDDYVFYFKNTGSEDLALVDLSVTAGAALTIYIDEVTGTAAGGTTLTPIARNLGSSHVPTASAFEGVDITGLTSAGVIYYERCAAASTRYYLGIHSGIIIPQGKAIGIRSSVANSTETIISVVGMG